ncbi:MAG: hypothetical protein AAF235_07660 [Planctomycetota bacterium]
MILTKELAGRVRDVVARDKRCIQLIVKGFYGGGLLGAAGLAGSARNLSYIITGADPSEPEIAQYACTGIANATSAVINAAIKAGNLKGVTSATTIDRQAGMLGVHHTATHVILPGGSAVFDWHATLEVQNPMVFRTMNWKVATGGTHLRQFEGF